MLLVAADDLELLAYIIFVSANEQAGHVHR